jgi:Icc protein
MGPSISRRTMLKAAGVLGAAGALGLAGPASIAAQATPAQPRRRRVLRLAHLTDLHIQAERQAYEGVVSCLHHVQSQEDKPDLILTGGDLIMDALATGRNRVKAQWDLLTKALKSECSIPIEHCLGNHDIWGWHKGKSGTTGNEEQWGKRWALDLLGLPGPYRSFDRAGWHFVVLDSVHPDGDDATGKYIGKLDEAQHEWLAADLAAVPATTPVLILSHIPILTVTPLVGGQDKDRRDWRVPAALMLTDWRRLHKLFQKHPNVKLALSGHMHLHDRVEYGGVTYICDGAVCGNWWKGRHIDCDEGYGLVDLYDDGTFEHRYVTYGWKAR